MSWLASSRKQPSYQLMRKQELEPLIANGPKKGARSSAPWITVSYWSMMRSPVMALTHPSI